MYNQERLCPAALAAHRWQTRMPKLWMPDLLRLPPQARSTALALQGVPCRFLGDFGHPVCVAQVADANLSDGHRGVQQRSQRQEHARVFPCLDVQYKTAFVLAHKLREAMAAATKALRIGGDGRTAEVDGAYFGDHLRPENLAVNPIDRRLAENQSGQRQVVVAMRERGGRTLA
ncbi:MAG: hypothetical protein QOD93_5415 [Acetobacteraceae bacterium]|nr:hypothetical protein [Acetobacteraceae bacterium]